MMQKKFLVIIRLARYLLLQGIYTDSVAITLANAEYHITGGRYTSSVVPVMLTIPGGDAPGVSMVM